MRAAGRRRRRHDRSGAELELNAMPTRSINNKITLCAPQVDASAHVLTIHYLLWAAVADTAATVLVYASAQHETRAH